MEERFPVSMLLGSDLSCTSRLHLHLDLSLGFTYSLPPQLFVLSVGSLKLAGFLSILHFH